MKYNKIKETKVSKSNQNQQLIFYFSSHLETPVR